MLQIITVTYVSQIKTITPRVAGSIVIFKTVLYLLLTLFFFTVLKTKKKLNDKYGFNLSFNQSTPTGPTVLITLMSFAF